MTIHEPNTRVYAWRCGESNCDCRACGYPSERAAAAAERHHRAHAHRRNAGAR